MNKSTLVPREEMSDLDWLARNVHVWPAGDHQPWCYVYMAHGGVMKAAGNFLDAVAKPTMITIDQWLARRAELQNKPSWADAPEWAEWLAKDSPDKDEESAWWWYADKPVAMKNTWQVSTDGRAWMVASCHCDLGDWRDTLEKRPEQSEFEPFVSVKDAATAKQPAPKGSGNPILGMVLADLTNRALEGKEKYGEPLLAHNGRNPLWDAYQEALDLAMYLRQAIEEQK